MKINYFIFILFLLSRCAASEEIEEKSPKKNRYQQAREVRSMSIDEVPPFSNKEAENYYFKGNEAKHKGERKKAKEYFYKSYVLEPTHVVNLNNLANACLYLDETEEAAHYLNIAFKLDSTAGITYANYTNFAIYTKQYSEGIRNGEIGVSKVKDSMSLGIIHINMAILYAYCGTCILAFNTFEKAMIYKNFLDPKAVMSIAKEIHEKCK